MLELNIPNTNVYLVPGDIVKLHRFDAQTWELDHGWYSFGGNRPFCGWFMKSNIDGEYIEKPVQMTDLDDIYLVKKSTRKEFRCL